MHVNAIPIQFRPQFPLTHMPFNEAPAAAQHQQQNQQAPHFRFGPVPAQPMPQVQSFRQIPLPLQPLFRQMQQAQSNGNPFHHTEQPEVRIQLQRFAIPLSHHRNAVEPQEANPEGVDQPNHQGNPQVQVQRIPLAIALQRAGITAEDLKNIQRMAEQRFQQELRELAQEDEASSEEEDSNEENRPHALAYGRMAFGRSLAQPINLPVPMQQIVEDQAVTDRDEARQVPTAAAPEEAERPHCTYNIWRSPCISATLC